MAAAVVRHALHTLIYRGLKVHRDRERSPPRRRSPSPRFRENARVHDGPSCPGHPTGLAPFFALRNRSKLLISFGMRSKIGFVSSKSFAGDGPSEERASELLIQEVVQRLQLTVGDSIHTAIRVRVEWRYRPIREIPVYWKQISTFPAGAPASNG